MVTSRNSEVSSKVHMEGSVCVILHEFTVLWNKVNRTYTKNIVTVVVRGVKRYNGVFIIPLFLFNNFRSSIIPAQKFSLFHYSSQKSTHYSNIPRTKFPLFQERINSLLGILIPLFLFSPPPPLRLSSVARKKIS